MPRPLACFMVASGRGLSEGYGYGGPDDCLGDGQTAGGVQSQGGRGDALFRRMSPITDLTWCKFDCDISDVKRVGT